MAKTKLDENAVVAEVRQSFPDIEAVYLFGSFADGTEDDGSDLDLALLFCPPLDRRERKNLFMHPLHAQLQRLTERKVDLLNLRQMPTVLQKEIVMLGWRIYCADEVVADEFDLGVLSATRNSTRNAQRYCSSLKRPVAPTTYERRRHQQDSEHVAMHCTCTRGV